MLFLKPIGPRENTNKLRQKQKMKKVKEGKITGPKCWFNTKILIWFWLDNECRFYHLYALPNCWKFSQGLFSCSSSAILTDVPSTLWTKTCCKLKGQQDMKKVSFCQRSLCIHVVSQFYMMEAVLPSPWSNFKLFTLVQYLTDLFSAAVSSTTL